MVGTSEVFGNFPREDSQIFKTMASVAPIIIPQDYMMVGSPRGKTEWRISGQNGIFLISLMQIVGSVVIIALYSYALGMKPDWYSILVPLSSEFCSNTQNITDGLVYVILLLCGMEFMLGLYLFEGARREKLGIIRFWMSSMFLYLVVIALIIIGMGLGGTRSPNVNFAVFLNIFVRFLEILMVYEWSEQIKLLRRQTSGGRRSGGTSTYTIFTVGDDDEEDGGGIGAETPPPSYSSTIPSASYRSYHQQHPEERQPLLYAVPEQRY